MYHFHSTAAVPNHLHRHGRHSLVFSFLSSPGGVCVVVGMCVTDTSASQVFVLHFLVELQRQQRLFYLRHWCIAASHNPHEQVGNMHPPAAVHFQTPAAYALIFQMFTEQLCLSCDHDPLLMSTFDSRLLCGTFFSGLETDFHAF